MKETENGKKPREYVAFISYRHTELDKKIAKKVHYMVEHYVIPKELRGPDGNKHLGKVFRDEEELPVSSNLTDSIQTALDHSKFLIVICTPNLPKSIWCEREITYFIEKHGRDHVVGILVDGTPETSFPKPLTQAIEVDAEGNEVIRVVEPLAANLTDVNHKYKEGRLRKEAVRLYAALLGCPFDSLWQREKRQKMRKLVALMGLVVAVALAFSASIYLKNLEINERNRQIEAQNVQIHSQNEEIKTQYAEIQDKNTDLKRGEAEALLQGGELKYQRGDTLGAIQDAIQAMSSPEGREAYGTEAEFLLYRAMGTGRYENQLRTVGVLEQEEDIRGMLLSKDGSRLYTLGDRSYVRCFSTETSQCLWLGDAIDRNYQFNQVARHRMTELSDQGILLICLKNQITALSLEDGSLRWNHVMELTDGADFSCLSDDGKTLAVIDGEREFLSSEYHLAFLDVATGEVIRTMELPEEIRKEELMAYGESCGAFSEDGRYFAGMIYVGRYLGLDRMGYLFLADLEKGEVRLIKSEDVSSANLCPFTIGMLCNGEDKSMLVMFYDAKQEAVRMDQVFFDGKTGETSAVPITLTEVGVGFPYVSTFIKENGGNNAILASCEGMNFMYRKDNGLLVTSGQEASDRILARNWINTETYAYSSIAGDGNIYAWYGGNGYSVTDFSDKKHIIMMEITDGYAKSGDGYGFELNENVVQAIVRDEDLRTVYLQKQAKDPGITAPEWAKEVTGAAGGKYSLKRLDEDTLLVIKEMEDQVCLFYVDVTAGELKNKAVLEVAALGERADYYTIRDAVYWKDQKHVSVQMMSASYTYDLAAKKLEDPFGITSSLVADSVNVMLENGQILQADLEYADGEWDAPADRIAWRLDDGEVKQAGKSGDVRWVGRNVYRHNGVLWGGAGKYVMTGTYEGDDEKRTGFEAFDVTTGAGLRIPLAYVSEKEPDVIMGNSKPLFALLDDDGVLRIYDLAGQALKKEIVLPAGQQFGGVAFGMEDAVIAVYSMDGRLFVYDVTTGNSLTQIELGDKPSAVVRNVNLRSFYDAKWGRLYFTISDGKGACLDVNTWNQIMILYGEVDTFFPKTNQIFKLNREDTRSDGADVILRQEALTLDELIENAKAR